MLKYVEILNTPKYFPIDGVIDDYIATEKIDGQNFQIVIYTSGDIKYFSRNKEIIEDDKNSIKGYKEVLERPEFVSLLKEAKDYLEFQLENAESVHFFGELFGTGIQGRVPYRENSKDILFFDMVISFKDGTNPYWFSREEMEQAFESFNASNLLVPVIVRGTWKDISEIDIENFMSVVSDTPAIGEGVVVRHYSFNRLIEERPRYLKLKGRKFTERNTKRPKLIVEITEQELLFSEYINTNRMLSFFSKEGNFNDIRKMSFYIKGILDDAWKDFVLDYPEYIEEKKEIIKKQGKKVSSLLMTYLEGNQG